MKKIVYLFIFIITITLLSSCSSYTAYECPPLYVFDTTVSMVFYDQSDYKNYYKEIKSKFNEISRATNDYQSNENNTSIYDLNLNREVESDILADIINCALEYMNMTNGYYNPFIGRLSHQWKDVIKSSDLNPLSNDVINNELNIMNSTSVTIEGNKITLNGDGNIDLGGIVKGYALEWAINYLKGNNVNKYYIDCGQSSIYVGDIDVNIALSKPYENDNIFVFKSSNIGVGTSSPKYQYRIINDVRYHHLINPFTGYPANYYDSVNVISNDNILNDVLSTTLFVMELEDIKALIKDIDCNILLYKDNEIVYQRNEL